MCSWWECPWPGCETKCHSNQCEVLKRQQERRRYQNSKKSHNIPPLTYRQCDKLGELKRKRLPPKEKLSQSHVCDKHKAAVRSQQTKDSTNRIRKEKRLAKNPVVASSFMPEESFPTLYGDYTSTLQSSYPPSDVSYSGHQSDLSGQATGYPIDNLAYQSAYPPRQPAFQSGYPALAPSLPAPRRGPSELPQGSDQPYTLSSSGHYIPPLELPRTRRRPTDEKMELSFTEPKVPGPAFPHSELRDQSLYDDDYQYEPTFAESESFSSTKPPSPRSNSRYYPVSENLPPPPAYASHDPDPEGEALTRSFLNMTLALAEPENPYSHRRRLDYDPEDYETHARGERPKRHRRGN